MAQFQTRLDLSNPTFAKYLTFRPLDSIQDSAERDAAMMCCSNQKIATTGTYQNFQLFGVMVVVAACLFLILTNVLLESTVALIRERWGTREARARQLTRDYDNRYWLMRTALQGNGVRNWRRGGADNDLPIPIIDQKYEVYPPREGTEGDEFYKAVDAIDASRPGSVEKN